MTFTFLDLEWQSAYCPEKRGFMNEIVEVGSLKLDENLRETGVFSRVVRSKLTTRLSGRFKELTGIESGEMREGDPLPEVLSEWDEWRGGDSLLLTWSRSDLYALDENCRLLAPGVRPVITSYADFQLYAQEEMRRAGAEVKSQVSLEHAAEAFGVDPGEYRLHRAAGDCRLCAEIMRRCYNGERLEGFITRASGENYLDEFAFRPYLIKDLSSPYIPRGELRFKCAGCGNYARRAAPWVWRRKFFRAPFRCRVCGESFLGEVSFTKTYSGVKVKKRTRPLSPDGGNS